jgi:hypothetical protein
MTIEATPAAAAMEKAINYFVHTKQLTQSEAEARVKQKFLNCQARGLVVNFENLSL